MSGLAEYLHRSPAVRDFTSAVFLAPELTQEWLNAHFDHDQMDVEADISVPYFVLSQSSETCISTPPPIRWDGKHWKNFHSNVVECYLGADRTLKDNEWLAHCLSIFIAKRKESV